MDFFYDLYIDLPRQGPGSNAATQKALGMIPLLPEDATVLDIGCGVGMQTIELARRLSGTIIAIDNYWPFLEALQKTAARESLSATIIPAYQSMDNLGICAQSVDLIWSEGAIYIIGFENGLKTWKPLLKPNGYLAVTEISWLKKNPPEEITTFWHNEYPAMQSIKENVKTIKSAGYELIDHFTLSECDWMNNYYLPQEKRITHFRSVYAHNSEIISILDSDWYGYEFYIMHIV